MNAKEGNVECSDGRKPRKWYNSYIFPLFPQLDIKKGNEHNTSGYTFSWLFFKIWSMDCCELEIGFCLSGHWGIGFLGLLPYTRWVVAIPFPVKASMWWQTNLWRKPKEIIKSK